ncbi:MAG: hypothetical protein ACK4NS_01470 [Saprospiraceae bacterium]
MTTPHSDSPLFLFCAQGIQRPCDTVCPRYRYFGTKQGERDGRGCEIIACARSPRRCQAQNARPGAHARGLLRQNERNLDDKVFVERLNGISAWQKPGQSGRQRIGQQASSLKAQNTLPQMLAIKIVTKHALPEDNFDPASSLIQAQKCGRPIAATFWPRDRADTPINNLADSGTVAQIAGIAKDNVASYQATESRKLNAVSIQIFKSNGLSRRRLFNLMGLTSKKIRHYSGDRLNDEGESKQD